MMLPCHLSHHAKQPCWQVFVIWNYQCHTISIYFKECISWTDSSTGSASVLSTYTYGSTLNDNIPIMVYVAFPRSLQQPPQNDNLSTKILKGKNCFIFWNAQTQVHYGWDWKRLLRTLGYAPDLLFASCHPTSMLLWHSTWQHSLRPNSSICLLGLGSFFKSIQYSEWYTELHDHINKCWLHTSQLLSDGSTNNNEWSYHHPYLAEE